jgi:hypothetical protein
MPLTLGKSFNRNYRIRVPFLDGHYDIGLFYDKNSTLLLFSIDAVVSSESRFEGNIINMFKNLEASKFCETFLELHNYRKSTLDISNQFNKIKPEYYGDLTFVFNESLTLSKVEVQDRTFYDSLNIYGFTLNSHIDEFLFVLAERQNIVKRLGKKVVRTSGLQVATKPALDMLDDYHRESREIRAGMEKRLPTDEIIRLSDVDKELEDDDTSR